MGNKDLYLGQIKTLLDGSTECIFTISCRLCGITDIPGGEAFAIHVSGEMHQNRLRDFGVTDIKEFRDPMKDEMKFNSNMLPSRCGKQANKVPPLDERGHDENITSSMTRWEKKVEPPKAKPKGSKEYAVTNNDDTNRPSTSTSLTAGLTFAQALKAGEKKTIAEVRFRSGRFISEAQYQKEMNAPQKEEIKDELRKSSEQIINIDLENLSKEELRKTIVDCEDLPLEKLTLISHLSKKTEDDPEYLIRLFNLKQLNSTNDSEKDDEKVKKKLTTSLKRKSPEPMHSNLNEENSDADPKRIKTNSSHSDRTDVSLKNARQMIRRTKPTALHFGDLVKAKGKLYSEIYEGKSDYESKQAFWIKQAFIGNTLDDILVENDVSKTTKLRNVSTIAVIYDCKISRNYAYISVEKYELTLKDYVADTKNSFYEMYPPQEICLQFFYTIIKMRRSGEIHKDLRLSKMFIHTDKDGSWSFKLGGLKNSVTVEELTSEELKNILKNQKLQVIHFLESILFRIDCTEGKNIDLNSDGLHVIENSQEYMLENLIQTIKKLPFLFIEDLLHHAFCWAPAKMSNFEDRIKTFLGSNKMYREMLNQMNNYVFEGKNWTDRMSKLVVEKYAEKRKIEISMCGNLDMSRNIRHHIDEYSEDVRKLLGSLPDEYILSRMKTFPKYHTAFYVSSLNLKTRFNYLYADPEYKPYFGASTQFYKACFETISSMQC